MTKLILNLIVASFLLLATQQVHAQDDGQISSLKKICDGENSGHQISIIVDASQLAILEYDRVSELLFFNIYKGVEYAPDLRLKPTLKGLAFPMSPDKAIEITRLYSMGMYKLEFLFLPVKIQRSEKLCEIHNEHRILHISLLRISLVNDKDEPVQSIITKRGRVLKAQATHAVRNYYNKSKPKVIIEIGGDTLSKAKVQKLRDTIKQPLVQCYRAALEKNGRYQGSIIFRFENGKTRAIHSNKNVMFGNCVTKSIEKNLPINFEKKITLKTIFRLERK